MGGGAKFFELLAGKDIDSDKVDLSVAVFASLRGRHVDDLAGAVLDHNEAILPQGRALHGEGGRGAGIGGLEGVFMLQDRAISIALSHGAYVTSVDVKKYSKMRPTGGGARAGCMWCVLPERRPPF